MEKKRINTLTLTGIAIFTAIVIILQLLGSFIRFGPFSISLVLIPIVVGSALYGIAAGGWLGLVFGLAVLLSGDAASFLIVNPGATILVVIIKGVFAGLCAGCAYKLIEKKNVPLAVLIAAIVCPVVNTGIFLLGCKLFFMDIVTEWATSLGFPSAGNYMIYGLTGGNFLFELILNIVFSPVIILLIRIGRKTYRKN